MRNPIHALGGLFTRAGSRLSLSTEQAGPAAFSFRNPHGGHPAAGLTPAKLAQILRASIDGDPMAYFELAEDMEERFPQYQATLSTRKRQVAGLQITVEPAGEEAADLAEAELVKEVVNSAAFKLSKIDQLDAIGKSFSCIEMIWDTSQTPWRPIAFKWRDQRHFKFHQVDTERLLLRSDKVPGGLEELKPNGWLVHRAKAKSGETVRGGLARQVAWLFLFASFNLKDWAIFAESFGHPIKVGKYGPGATPADIATLITALKSIGADAAAAIPNSMLIEFEQANVTGSVDLFERRDLNIDQKVSKIVLGQTGTTDVIKGGGYASSKVHDKVRDDIEEADAEQWAGTLNEQLVPPLILFNFPARKRNGFPEIKIGRPEEEDVTALVDNVVKLVPLGIEVDMAEMQRKIGVTPPGAGAKLLVAPKRPAPVVAPASGAAPPSPEGSAAASMRTGEGDAIDAAIAEMLTDGGWEPLVAPVVDGLEQEISAAGSVDEVREILKRRAATMGLAAFTDLLARSAFVARLAGEAEESLS